MILIFSVHFHKGSGPCREVLPCELVRARSGRYSEWRVVAARREVVW